MANCSHGSTTEPPVTDGVARLLDCTDGATEQAFGVVRVALAAAVVVESVDDRGYVEAGTVHGLDGGHLVVVMVRST